MKRKNWGGAETAADFEECVVLRDLKGLQEGLYGGAVCENKDNKFRQLGKHNTSVAENSALALSTRLASVPR